MLSTKEAAAELGVPLGTLKRWVSELPIPLEHDGAGARRYGDEAIEVLRRVHELRLGDRHFESIRVILSPGQPGDGIDPGPIPEAIQPAGQPAAATDDAVAGPALDRAEPGPALSDVATAVGEAIAERMSREIGEVLRRENDLAEKYARAAHRIGELEATTRSLEAERERLAGEVAELKVERGQARAFLAAPPEPKRPWWKVWS